MTEPIDPTRLGVVEPGRQEILLHDRVLGEREVAALLVGIAMLLLVACRVAPFYGPGGPESPILRSLGLWIAGGAAAVALLCALVWVHWWWLGPTVLVLRSGALALTHARVTRTVPFADLRNVSVRRRTFYSELELDLADERIVVPIAGSQRARAMALAIAAARGDSAEAAAPEEPAPRQALERLRHREPPDRR